MNRELDHELQPLLARDALRGLSGLCDAAVPGVDMPVAHIGAMLRLIVDAMGMHAPIDDQAPPP